MTNTDREFTIVPGKGGYKIVDSNAVEYGSFPDAEIAERYCERLNAKWQGRNVRT